MKKGDRQVGNEWIYLGVLQRIGFDQLSWKDDGLRRRGTARQRIPAVSTANAMVETVCFWLLQRVGVRPDFALPLYWSGCCFEYLEWAGAAPCSEPGQVREEAAIRDRWRAPLPIRDTFLYRAVTARTTWTSSISSSTCSRIRGGLSRAGSSRWGRCGCTRRCFSSCSWRRVLCSSRFCRAIRCCSRRACSLPTVEG